MEPTNAINLIPDPLQQKIKAARETFQNTTRFREIKDFISNIIADPSDEFILNDYLKFDTAFVADQICNLCIDFNKCPHNPKGFKPTLENEFCNLSIRFVQCEKSKVEEWQKKIQKLLESSRLPEKFKKKTFDTFEMSDGTKKGYEIALGYCKGENKKGIVFAGAPGTGKTHIASAIMNFRISQGMECVFCTVPELLEDIRRAMKSNDETSELMEIIKNTPLLILDDLGAEKTTEWVAEKLFVIFNARLVREKDTMLTTNYEHPSELIEKLGGGITGQRIVSRIREMCDWVVMSGPDYRLYTR